MRVKRLDWNGREKHKGMILPDSVTERWSKSMWISRNLNLKALVLVVIYIDLGTCQISKGRARVWSL